MINSGNSVITARPMPSDFSDMPGPLVPVTPIAPPKAAPITAVIAEISSSAWKVRTPKFLRLDKLVQDVAGGSDRIGAVEQIAAAELGGGHQAPGQCLVSSDVGYVPGGNCGRIDRIVASESLRVSP